MSLSSNYRRALFSLAAAFMAALLPTSEALSQEPVAQKSGFQDALEGYSKDNPLPVDKHLFLLVDISASIDNHEYRQIMKGVSEALLSSDLILSDVKQGYRVALSLIFFNGNPYYETSYYISSEQALSEFVEKYVWDKKTDQPKQRVNYHPNGTHIVAAIKEAQALVNKHRKIGFGKADRADILIITDGTDNDPYYSEVGNEGINVTTTFLSKEVQRISNEDCLRISVVPVMTTDGEAPSYLDKYFSHDPVYGFGFVTPEGATCTQSFGGRSHEVGLPSGDIFIARGEGDIKRAVRLALNAPKF